MSVFGEGYELGANGPIHFASVSSSRNDKCDLKMGVSRVGE